MKVRKAIISDAKGIAKVHVDSWKTTYKHILPPDYLSKLSYEQREKVWVKNIEAGEVFVAENGQSEIIGFSTGGVERSKKYPDYAGELYAIYILKEYQQQGLGRALIELVVEQLQQQNINSMIVLVLEANHSRYFYEALGAKQIDSLNIEIAGCALTELVYAWENITSAINK